MERRRRKNDRPPPSCRRVGRQAQRPPSCAIEVGEQWSTLQIGKEFEQLWLRLFRMLETPCSSLHR